MNIKADILGLKHRVEMKQGNLHYNSDISRGSSVNHVTLNRFLKNTIKIVSLSVLTRFARHFRSQGLNIELGDFFCWEGDELVSNIGPLIRQLDPIPTDEQIAQETQIPLLRVNNLVKGNVKRVHLTDLEALLVFFRQRGIEIELGYAFGGRERS